MAWCHKIEGCGTSTAMPLRVAAGLGGGSAATGTIPARGKADETNHDEGRAGSRVDQTVPGALAGSGRSQLVKRSNRFREQQCEVRDNSGGDKRSGSNCARSTCRIRAVCQCQRGSAPQATVRQGLWLEQTTAKEFHSPKYASVLLGDVPAS